MLSVSSCSCKRVRLFLLGEWFNGVQAWSTSALRVVHQVPGRGEIQTPRELHPALHRGLGYPNQTVWAIPIVISQAANAYIAEGHSSSSVME